MTDPIQKMRLEEIPFPTDLWDEIQRRGPRAPAREPRGRRLLAIVAALVISAAGIAFVVWAFPRGEPTIEKRNPAILAVPTPTPRTVESPGDRTESLVQGMTLTRPSNWTLTHLPGEVDGAWPVLQLTNYDPGLQTEGLCPHAANLPDDGVLLYVEKDLELTGEYAEWPVQPNGDENVSGPCGVGIHPRWTMEASAFEAFLAFGPEAADRDQRLLLDAYASLDLRDLGKLRFWHTPSELVEENERIFPWFTEPAQVLLSLDPTGSKYLNLLRYSGSLLREVPGGFSELPTFKPGEHVEFGGDHMEGGSGVVDGSVIASADVARVEIHANDGRVIPCALGPVAAGFRFGRYEFEEPLVGEFVAYDESGKVLDRERYALWPP